MKLFQPRDTPAVFWQRLARTGLAQGEMPASPANADGDDSPWYVKVMLYLAAWVSAVLLLIFVFSVGGAALLKSGWTRAILGMAVCAGVAFYFRSRTMDRSTFGEQIVFILGLVGQGLVLTVLWFDRGMFSSFNVWWLLLDALFGVVVFVAIPYSVNRFLSAAFVLGVFYQMLMLWSIPLLRLKSWADPAFVTHMANLNGLFTALCLAALAVVLRYQWRLPRVWPMVALALSLVPFYYSQMGFTFAVFRMMAGSRGASAAGMGSVSLGQASLLLVWLGIVYALLKQVTGKPWARENIGIWLLALVFAAGAWPVPMALAALAVYFLGFSQRDRLLQGIGIAELLWSVSYYYYSQNHTLLFKSQTLLALGVVLLLFYAVSRYLYPEKTKTRQGRERA